MQTTNKKIKLRDRLLSFRYAWHGLSQVLKKELHFRIHLFAAIAVVLSGFLFKVSRTDWLVLILCIGLVMALEVLNSAVERMVDLVSPHKSEQAKLIKDMAAGAVLLAALCAMVAGTVVLLPYFVVFIKQL
jgi:diacylglycerol kinase (ATP)